MSISTHQMRFDGELLERGFWLYVWEITEGPSVHVYVGRTGDSSSSNAASPFNRIGQHLDFRENARGNSLAKWLKEAGINPKKSNFRMLALGPLFQEQETFEAHKPIRDKMASLEYELACHLKNCGFKVMGIHHPGKNAHGIKLCEVKSKVIDFLQNKNG